MKKYTTLQLASDTAWAPSRDAGLRRTSKLSDFNFTPVPGFLYVTARAISSRVNANFDAWPADELRNAYRSFVGRPVFVDHNNWDHKRSRGAILDAKLYEDKLASGHDDVWIELLIEVDAQQFPKLASAIMSGDVDGVSMGADVEYTICSVCSNKAREVTEYCAHIPQMKGKWIQVEDKVAGKKKSVLCFEDCHGVGFFEISMVFDPADESALISDKQLFMASSEVSNRLVSHLRLPDENVQEYRTRLARVASKQADQAVMSIPAPINTSMGGEICPMCGAPELQTVDDSGLAICDNCGTSFPPTELGDPDTEEDGMQPELQQNAPADDSKSDKKPKSDDKKKKKDKSDSKSPFGKSKDDSKKKNDSGSRKKDQKKSNEGGKILSRYAEVAQKEADVAVPPYHQETSPEQTVTPYGTAGPEGAPTAPPEPPVDSTMGERTQQTQIDPRSLDEEDIQGPPGQSEVQTPKGEQAPLEKPAAKDENEDEDDEEKTASAEDDNTSLSREDLLRRALFHARRAAFFRREADNVGVSDVENLDEGAPPAVDFGPDGHANLLAPTEEGPQLQDADWSQEINDGRETGAGYPTERPQPPSSFNTVTDYGTAVPAKPAAKQEPEADEARRRAAARFAKEREEQRINAAKTRVLRVANFVAERVKLGLTQEEEKFDDIARFEEMDDRELEGHIEATKEFKRAQATREQGRRIRVNAGRAPQDDSEVPTRLPQLGSMSKSASTEENDTVTDYLTFI